MLLKYNVTNFKSIGEQVEFSMFPLDNEDDRFLIPIKTKIGEWKILRRGALFGPNASGKTTFIDSIHYSQNYILKGPLSNKVTRVNQFKGFEDKLSTFQYVIYIDEEVYEYGFSMDRFYVHEEWLYQLNENGEMKPLFTRITNSEKNTSINITSDYATENTEARQIAELLVGSIKENQANQLFLKKLAENGSEKAEAIINWFEKIVIIYPSSTLRALPVQIKEDDDFREFLTQHLGNMDTGVNNISTSTEEYTIEKFREQFNLSDDLLKEIEEKGSGIISINGKYFIFSDERKGHATFIKLEFEHMLNGKTVPLNLEEESDGTRRMIDLLPMLFKIEDDKSNKIYIVDELDRSLHTKLSKEFVRNFEKTTRNICAQLIFTAHDVNLLDMDLFRQEEIWFIDKKNSGETRFRPFSDFNIKKEQDIFKDYLNGRFGAVPVIHGGNDYGDD